MLGAGSILGALFAVLDVVPVLLAVIFGIVVLRSGQPGRRLAIAGISCAAAGAVLAILMSVAVLHAVNKCGGLDNANDPAFSTCVQQHL